MMMLSSLSVNVKACMKVLTLQGFPKIIITRKSICLFVASMQKVFCFVLLLLFFTSHKLSGVYFPCEDRQSQQFLFHWVAPLVTLLWSEQLMFPREGDRLMSRSIICKACFESVNPTGLKISSRFQRGSSQAVPLNKPSAHEATWEQGTFFC